MGIDRSKGGLDSSRIIPMYREDRICPFNLMMVDAVFETRFGGVTHSASAERV